jgi:DNA-binding MarR family transcriptional regulator
MTEKNPYDKIFKIVDFLQQEKATPSKIALHIKSDIRTTSKMLSSLEKRNMIEKDSINTGKRTYSLYSLSGNQINSKWRKNVRR